MPRSRNRLLALVLMPVVLFLAACGVNSIPTAEEAAKRIEASWNKVTNDVGRDTQIKIWRKGVELGIYLDKF